MNPVLFAPTSVNHCNPLCGLINFKIYLAIYRVTRDFIPQIPYKLSRASRHIASRTWPLLLSRHLSFELGFLLFVSLQQQNEIVLHRSAPDPAGIGCSQKRLTQLLTWWRHLQENTPFVCSGLQVTKNIRSCFLSQILETSREKYRRLKRFKMSTDKVRQFQLLTE